MFYISNLEQKKSRLKFKWRYIEILELLQPPEYPQSTDNNLIVSI
jgi:hypothetical protein